MRVTGRPAIQMRSKCRYFCSNHNNNNSGNELKHRYKKWYGDRLWRLTASTFGAALGFHRGRRMELWLEKIGVLEPFSGSPAIWWNNRHEDMALDRYRLITGNPITYTSFQIHPKYDYLGASPDGVITCPGSHGVLEIKCPYYHGNPADLMPWTCIPSCYMPQAQGLMEILDMDWMDFYVWTPRGSSLFRVERNQRYWELVMGALMDFWWDHVMPARTVRETDPNRNVSYWRPDSWHKLFQLIEAESILICQDSRLLVREIHGNIAN